MQRACGTVEGRGEGLEVMVRVIVLTKLMRE